MSSPEINFGAYYGTQKLWREVDLLNARQYMEVYNDGWTNRWGAPEDDNGNPLDQWFCYEGEGNCYNTYVAGTDTDWLAQVTRSAPMSNMEGSVTDGFARRRSPADRGERRVAYCTGAHRPGTNARGPRIAAEPSLRPPSTDSRPESGSR